MPEDFVTPVHPLSGSEPEVQMPVPPNSQKLSETPRSAEFHVLPEIDNTNRNFKGQQKNELVHCFCRKHWIVLVPHFIGALLIAVGLVAFISFSSVWNAATYRVVSALIILGLTYYFHYFFIRFFNYYLQIIIVTNFRVIHLDQTLYFHRNRDSIDLPEIQDIVILQNGIIKTLFNYGEIIITLSSAHSSKTLVCVPNPEYYFRKINKTKREYITVRRMEKGKTPIKE